MQFFFCKVSKLNFTRHFSAVFVFFLLVSSVSAQTAAQLKQFSSLSPSQQEALARQLGVDVSAIRSQTASADSKTPVETPSYPRGTTFDQYGEPTEPDYDYLSDTEVETELSLFGQSLFDNGPSTFSPQLNGDVPDDYKLGVGDELNIQLFGKENNEFVLRIGVDGQVSIPEIGPTSLVGKTYKQAQDLLAEKIQQARLGVDVIVSLTKLKSIRVFISGEAYKPGAYNLAGLSTITNALYAAGGVSDIASLRNIKLNRQGTVHTVFDLYDLLIHGDASDDAILKHGDVLHIPVAKKIVSIDGEVARPAKYELKNEKTLAELLAIAGGATSNAFTKYIGIKRITNGGLVQVTVDFSDSNFILQAGDEIEIPEVSDNFSDSVTLIGAVSRPGNYQWYDGLSVKGLIGDLDNALLQHADPSYVLVVRQPSITSEMRFLQVDLVENDAVLMPKDKVLVFSVIESIDTQEESIDDLVATEKEIVADRKERLKEFVEERIEMQNFGVYDMPSTSENEQLEESQPSVVSLSDNEVSSIKLLRSYHPFSRTILLADVIDYVEVQSSFMNPPKIIEVGGAVRVPGKYPLTENAGILDAIKAAGGLLPQANSERSELTRFDRSKGLSPVIQHIGFSPITEINNSRPSIQLQNEDRINIFTVPNWQEEIRVTLRGEVVFPGEYTVARGETLAQLVERAGGFTSYADVNALVFTRESLRRLEKSNLEKLAEELRKEIASESLRRDNSAGAIVSYDEARKLLRDLTLAEAVGRLVINNSGENSELNVVLEDEDTVVVPKISQVVNVIGEVYVPTAHLFDDDLSFEDYIQRSGGFRPLADAERAYIIRANGSVDIPDLNSNYWFSDSQSLTKIQAGDTLVIPYDSDRVDNVTLWTNATQIIYQLAVAVAAIGSL